MKNVWALLLLVACHSSEAHSPASQEIAMCTGQNQVASAARTGVAEPQLAPAFLDQMPTCNAAPPAKLAVAAAGSVNAKGDCEWPNGVKCHFHLGAEFVESGAPRPKVGELHCIFPVDSEPKSPQVFGTHFTCKAGAITKGRAIRAGETCGAGLLASLASAMSSCDARCCDDGTLTNPTEDRRTAGTLDVRPDFRICRKTAELDCAALAPLTGHSANAPVFGAPVEEPF